MDNQEVHFRSQAAPAFTPGPWRIHEPASGPLKDIAPSQGLLISTRDGVGDIAFLSFDDGDRPTAANARLIAAAPDLYVALRDLCRLIENSSARASAERAGWFIAAHAALALADGVPEYPRAKSAQRKD